MEKKLLRISKAAEILDIPMRSLRDAALLEKINAVRVGSRWYVSPKEIDRIAKEGLKNGR
jgi:hypothetical protein